MPDFESPIKEEMGKGGQKKVLVIDDDKRFLGSLERSTRNISHMEIKHVTTASDAIKEIENADPEIVFLDHEFETGTGLDVVNHFKSKENVTEFVSTTLKGAMDEYAERGIEHVNKRNLSSILREIGKEDFSD